MENNKDKNNKKKDKMLMRLCIGGIVLFLFLTIYSFATNKKDKLNAESSQESNQEDGSDFDTLYDYDNFSGSDQENSTDTETDVAANAEADSADTEQDAEEWQDDDSTYNEDFHYNSFPEELLPMVDNDTDGMIKNMQEVLFENGYYSYTEARFQDYVEIDYAAQTVSLSYEVFANETVNVSAVYSRNTKTWNTVIW